MKLQECKYRLPCNWCDKYNRRCEHIEALIAKSDCERIMECECEHEWRYEGQLGNRHHYRCIKCDTLKAVPLENLSSTDKECIHEWISCGAAMITVESPTTPIGCYEYLVCEKCGNHMLKPYEPHAFKT